jgi:putative CocE/NonD family hydrolase
MKRFLFSALAILITLPTVVLAQRGDQSGSEYVRENFTKYEYRIAMRDGALLFTSVYVPKTCSEPQPILLKRTPYSVSPYGADRYPRSLGPSEHLMKKGFIFAVQDVRGRVMSEGNWIEVRPHDPDKGPTDTDESTDTWDTIEWLVENVPCNNGRVGMWGVSYPGFYASAGMIDAHPALKAVSPQAPVTDYYLGDDSYHNGAFMLAANYRFYSYFKPRPGPPEKPPKDRASVDFGTEDGYKFFMELGPLWAGAEKSGINENPHWRINLEHTTYDDFWQARSLWRHFKNITPAVLTVGGWYDAEDPVGPLITYKTIKAESTETTNHLVMGPWTHGSWAWNEGRSVGNVNFGQPTGEYYREHIEMPFFLKHLEGGEAPELAEAHIFEVGTNRWREFDAWPPENLEPKTIYLAVDGTLSPDAPTDVAAFDEYVSDPHRPVPYVGYVQLGMQRDYMTEDQRFAAQRTDVLVYQTSVLEEDLTVLGPITVNLHVSTTGTDSDFVVKVIDVYPDDYPSPEWDAEGRPPANHVRMGGYQQLVRGEPFRGKYRHGFSAPEPFVPGEPDLISFELPDVAHTFRSGHRLMIQIQSSWFPLTDRNPQTFVEIPHATEEDFQKATQRVYRSIERPSSITVLVE